MQSHAARINSLHGLWLVITLLSVPALTAGQQRTASTVAAGQQRSVTCEDPAKSTVSCESNQMPKCVTEKLPDPNNPNNSIYRVNGSCTNTRAGLWGAEYQAWVLSNALGKTMTAGDVGKEPYATILDSGRWESGGKVVTFATPPDENPFPQQRSGHHALADEYCELCVRDNSTKEQRCQRFLKGNEESRATAIKELCGSDQVCTKRSKEFIQRCPPASAPE